MASLLRHFLFHGGRASRLAWSVAGDFVLFNLVFYLRTCIRFQLPAHLFQVLWARAPLAVGEDGNARSATHSAENIHAASLIVVGGKCRMETVRTGGCPRE